MCNPKGKNFMEFNLTPIVDTKSFIQMIHIIGVKQMTKISLLLKLKILKFIKKFISLFYKI